MVKVKLFANFREIVGRNEVEIPASSVLDLLTKLIEQYPELKRLIFKNGGISDYVHIVVNGRSIRDLDGLNTGLGDDDVVAIFPPVSGG